MSDPLTVPCPACQSGVGTACTQATNEGRRPVAWFHYSREADADSA